MPATVKLRLGDLFDGPSDLIVLPCNADGTVSGDVALSLSTYSIPRPQRSLALGEVEILPFAGGDDIAMYVAFAASVRANTSRVGAIESIGKSLGKFTCQQPSVRSVAAPMLGTRAGGMSWLKAVGALANGFVATGDPAATLRIHVRDEVVFDDIRAAISRNEPAASNPRRVFISHTSKSQAAQDWVKDLAGFLIENGINARLDQLHLRHGMDLPQWMTNEITMADRVLIVCDEHYKQKADGRLGGVGWETMIIQGDMMNLPADSTKYQVILRSHTPAEALPLYLRTRYAFNAPAGQDDHKFRGELLEELTTASVQSLPAAVEFSLQS